VSVSLAQVGDGHRVILRVISYNPTRRRTPTIPGQVTNGPSRVDQQGREPLHPPIQGDVVHFDATLGKKLFEVPVGQPVPEVPAHRVPSHGAGSQSQAFIGTMVVLSPPECVGGRRQSHEMARSLLERIHNPRNRDCGCDPDCWCRRTASGRAVKWWFRARVVGLYHKDDELAAWKRRRAEGT
jgi:hypothetical protein